jgi:drug/metabolite transporter (DMT)-like permease
VSAHRTAEARPATASLAGVGLTVSILLLGVNWPVMKLALAYCPPLWLAAARMLLAACLGAAVLGLRGRLAWPRRQDVGIVLVLGLFQGSLMFGLVTIGVGLVGAGRAAVLTYATSIWIIPGARLMLGECASPGQLAGFGLGLLGVAALLNPFAMDWSDRHVLVGNSCLVVASLAWAYAILRVRGHRWSVEPFTLLPHHMALGGLLVALAAGTLEGWAPQVRWDGTFLVAFGYTAVLATFIAFWLVVEAARRLPSVRVALAQLATPVIGVVSSALMLGETPRGPTLAGLALIVAGVAVSLRRRPPASR